MTVITCRSLYQAASLLKYPKSKHFGCSLEKKMPFHALYSGCGIIYKEI